jgi:hypothetical protein
MCKLMIKRWIIVVVSLCVGLCVSCNGDESGCGGKTDEVKDQAFVGAATRFDAVGDPQHGEAYTMIGYKTGGSVNDRYQISDANQYGFYAYDDGSSYGVAGALIPVAINALYAPSAGINPLVRAWNQGMKLSSTITNPVRPGVYRIAMIHPAIPMVSTGAHNLGFLAVFNPSDSIWASSPDDVDGMGHPFEITITTNGQVNELPNPTELYPIKAAVKVWLFSEYYDEVNDPDHTIVKEQKFSIGTMYMYNTGSNGWFNARTGIVYPNYNYTATYTGSYSPTLLLPPGVINNYVDMGPAVTADNVTPAPDLPDFPTAAKNIQWYAETLVFPSDYRGVENGGLQQVIPMTLRLELNMDAGGVNKASVPISLVIESGKRYNFYINVKSELIEIIYNVSPWQDGGTDDGNIGGPMNDYASIELTYSSSNWGNGGGSTGSDNIGN